MVQRNQFIDGDLSDRTSLIHLLDNNDSEDDNEAHIVKHSPYYNETDFSKLLQKKGGLSILSVNILFLRRRFISTKQIYKKIIHTIPYTLYTREKK